MARRTVSRWETGSNMPDMDILIELSDLYSVDLREILDGKKIIATNGFVKKTQKTPAKELKLAKERRADWLSRHKEG